MAAYPCAAPCHHTRLAPLRWIACGRLGSGSFGDVSLGLDLQDHSLFAIKSCPESSPLFPSLFNELNLLQSLSSPFVVRCLGSINMIPPAPSGPPLPPSLFLEYMDCGSLADLRRRLGDKFMDESLVAHCTQSILQGLLYLHQNGIVHCDIKGQNILLSSSGAVKIADFGAAHHVGESVSPKALKGTPLYMAPEVVRGEEQGPPSDIWSLGCTVVEMLQGSPPWAHITNVAALFLKLLFSQDNVPLPETVSPEAKSFLQQCFQRDPKARPTAAELLQHPFLRSSSNGRLHLAAENSKHCAIDAVSPTTTLRINFSHSESEPGCSCASSLCTDFDNFSGSTASGSDPESSSIRSHQSQESVAPRSEWITVTRCATANACAGFLTLQADTGAMSIRRAGDVSLESAAFLRNRSRRRLNQRTTVG